MAAQPLIVAGSSRPYPGETENGDAWQVDWHGGACRLSVIDGLGHGPPAAEAARAARQALAAAPDLLPDHALRLCHHALRGTRGAVVAIAHIDPTGRLTYAGIGNVEARVRQDDSEERLISYRGIVGSRQIRYRSFTIDLGPKWLLLLHTDGISARWDTDHVLAEAGADPQALADFILAHWGRQTDDATIVVARPA